MVHHRWVVPCLLVFVTFLSGCSQTLESGAPQPLGFDILRDAKPVPLAASQALSLSFGTHHGLEAMSNMTLPRFRR